MMTAVHPIPKGPFKVIAIYRKLNNKDGMNQWAVKVDTHKEKAKFLHLDLLAINIANSNTITS